MQSFLEKRISLINGFGIFTNKFIAKNSEFYKIPLDVIYSESKLRCARIGDKMFVCDELVLNWINHSCNPNSNLDITRDMPVLVALRDIFPSEEITVDYNKTELNGNKVKCNCNSLNCRGYFIRL